jgi:Flp pilus assembly protein TadG
MTSRAGAAVTGGRKRRVALADQAGFLLASAVRLLLVFSLLGAAANEVGQMIMAKIRVENAAAAAAQAGATAWTHQTSLLSLRQTVAAALADNDPDATLTGIQVKPQGAVQVDAVQTANTLVLRRVSFLRRFGVQTGDQVETRSP